MRGTAGDALVYEAKCEGGKGAADDALSEGRVWGAVGDALVYEAECGLLLAMRLSMRPSAGYCWRCACLRGRVWGTAGVALSDGRVDPRAEMMATMSAWPSCSARARAVVPSEPPPPPPETPGALPLHLHIHYTHTKHIWATRNTTPLEQE